MLESLNEINWRELRQAHGDSTHIPKALRELISGDVAKEEQACWNLDNHVVLQGDLYEAAFYILPFCYEILESDISSGRKRVYDLLFEIANGYEARAVSCTFKDEDMSLTDACRNSILDQKELFLKEVSNRSSSCRVKALELLCSFYEISDYLIEQLVEVKETEKDESFKLRLEQEISELCE